MIGDAERLWWTRLQGSRWFGGRGRDGELVRLTALPWITPHADNLPSSWPAVRPELAEVVYADGTQETYQIIASYRPLDDDTVPMLGLATLAGIGQVRVSYLDDDQAAMRAIAKAFSERTKSTDGTYTLVFHRGDETAALLTQPPAVMAGDQSNTLLTFGAATCKVIRRFEWGAQRAVTLGEALRGCKVVPPLWGYAEVHGPEGVAHLAVLSQRIDQPRDGWQLATRLAALREPDATWAADIGRALADVHTALADPHHDMTEAIGLPGTRLADEIRASLDEAVTEIPELEERRAQLEAILAPLAGVLVPTQRIHGDFHLGQTLVNHEHWWIVDFDGEPLLPLAERGRLDSPLRDVAGLLRSLDYARASAPDPASPDAHRWADDARNAFLTAYTERRGSALEPAEHTILRSYIAQKAIYEARYEARHRPTWLPIPLAALAELNEQNQGE